MEGRGDKTGARPQNEGADFYSVGWEDRGAGRKSGAYKKARERG
jgi:hypothetical protein